MSTWALQKAASAGASYWPNTLQQLLLGNYKELPSVSIIHKHDAYATKVCYRVAITLNTTGVHITTNLSHHELYSIPGSILKVQLYWYNHRIRDLEKHITIFNKGTSTITTACSTSCPSPEG